MPRTESSSEVLDAVIVGAGFGGLYMLHRLRGMGLSARILESGGGVGGTWYWNRYPGARCDVESMQYSYQFDDALQQEWEWTERYATQPEILRYIEHVAERYDLQRDIRFETQVKSAAYDETVGRWVIETDKGDPLSATFCIMATGCLSAPNAPDFAGAGSFRGATYFTCRWPHKGVDFTDLRVGIVGTGSSAIQSIPLIAERAARLHVFQRSPNYSIPAHNAPLDPGVVREIKDNYAELRARAKTAGGGLAFPSNPAKAMEVDADKRRRVYEERWAFGGVTFMDSFSDLLLDSAANDTAAEFVRGKIREIVDNPAVAELLSPRDIIGCKRLCVDTGYYATYNRPNVTLVDVSATPIEAVTETGLRVDGREYSFDAIVFATGFDAMTGALTRIDIRGRGGQSLRDKWAEGPRTYLGVVVAGFPNLFTITGPGSPAVLANMVPGVEQHADWIGECIGFMRERGASRIEPTIEAEDDWVARNGEVARDHLRSTCNSWYVGANVSGKPRVFTPYISGLPSYLKECERVVAAGYAGFTFR